MKLHLRQECSEEILIKAHDLEVCVDNALLDETAAFEDTGRHINESEEAYQTRRIDVILSGARGEIQHNISKLNRLLALLDWLQENVK